VLLQTHYSEIQQLSYYKCTTTTTNILFPETHKLGLYPIYQTFSYFIPFPVFPVLCRSSLGVQLAKALIAICAAEKAKCDPTQEFKITLSVLGGVE
jgi:hypothetical protein